jgi:HD-like signal output (HDOD) protein
MTTRTGTDAVAEPGRAPSTAFGGPEFLASLETELRNGTIELPSWSKVTERARNALSRPEINNDELAKLLGAEAGLAVRVLTVANSALFTRGGRPLSDLRLAIMRIGHDNLRSAVYSYALAQLRQAPRLQHLRAPLQRLWHESTTVAALTRLVAVRTGSCDPDAALLAGLLHNIGKLYILSRLDDGAWAALDEAERATLLLSWHARLGGMVAANWQLGEALSAAIAEQETLDLSGTGQSALGAALAVALIGASAEAGDDSVAVHLATFTRFAIDTPGWLQMLEQARTESAALRAAFGD